MINLLYVMDLLYVINLLYVMDLLYVAISIVDWDVRTAYTIVR